MTDVHVSLDVGDEDLTLAHGVLSVLRHVDGYFHGSTELKLVGFDWDHTDQRHLNDELLGVLVVQAVLLDAPFGALEEETLDVGASIEALRDLCWIALLRNLSIHQTLIEWPLASATCRLKQSCEVGLWDFET